MVLNTLRMQLAFITKSLNTSFRGISFVIILLCAHTTFAQTYQSEVEIIQGVLGLEKKAAVAEFMQLKDSDTGFWKIYDAYELERKELGKERIQIIGEYAKNFSTLSDEKILDLFKRSQALRKSFNNLQSTYFNKMKKAVGVKKAAQFWQIEGYFSSIIQAKIYTEIPFIGEKINQK